MCGVVIGSFDLSMTVRPRRDTIRLVLVAAFAFVSSLAPGVLPLGVMPKSQVLRGRTVKLRLTRW